MTIEANLSRITELLEVLTEVVVEKLYDEKDERCDEGCLCNGEDDSSRDEADIEFVSVGFSRPEIVVPLLDWLTEQINFAGRTKDTAKALFCEQIADKIDELRKRPAND